MSSPGLRRIRSDCCEERNPSRKILVLGTGRAGTHWIASILQSHPDVRVTVEASPMFAWSTAMAMDPRTKTMLMPRLVASYRRQHAAVAPRHYADKSHPNIWHAEELASRLPDALFIGIQRNPFATVASMLKHAGVLAWHDRWRGFPVPNRFLGITPENRDVYDAFSPASKCALRWQAHARQLDALRAALGQRLIVVSYEALSMDPANQARRMSEFLGLASALPTPAPKIESLNRWQQELSPDDRHQVAMITGISDRITTSPA